MRQLTLSNVFAPNRKVGAADPRPARRLPTVSPSWVVMRAMGRFETVRALMTWLAPRHRALDAGSVESVFREVDLRRALTDLHQAGFATGLNLPAETLNSIIKYATSDEALCRDPSGRLFVRRDRPAIGRAFPTATCINAHERCGAIRRLQNDPTLLRLAAAYLRTTPAPIGTSLRWTFANQAGDGDFRCKLNDYRSITFRFFLSNVDSQLGPLSIVRGTHLRRRWRESLMLTRPRSERAMFVDYGSENVLILSGPAGFGAAMDPLCYHREVSTRSRDRLVLEITFARHEYARSIERSGAWSVPASPPHTRPTPRPLPGEAPRPTAAERSCTGLRLLG
ncbi:MAG: hypothetical protein ACREJC_01310 [Tepidisphaeraceae bacterium]